jgi:hypothetical protein
MNELQEETIRENTERKDTGKDGDGKGHCGRCTEAQLIRSGHSSRMEESRWTKKALKYILQEKRE